MEILIEKIDSSDVDSILDNIFNFRAKETANIFTFLQIAKLYGELNREKET
jgi:hypothetical protein